MARFYYKVTLEHPGLHKHRVLRGEHRHLVEAAAQAQRRAWAEQYARKLEVGERRAQREAKKEELEDQQREAEERTREAQEALQALSDILPAALREKSSVTWSSLKQEGGFSQPAPQPRPYVTLSPEPVADDPRFQPQLNLLDKLWQGSAQKKQQAAQALFAAEHAIWAKRLLVTQASNEVIYAQNLQAYQDWQLRHDAFQDARAAHNRTIDERAAAYQALQPDAVAEFSEMVLARSSYPEFCPQDFEVEYRGGSRSLVVDYELPEPDALPRLTEVKYQRTRRDFREVELSPKQSEAQYADVVCQITLRTLYELFASDAVRALGSIVANGHVTALDVGTGHRTRRCILSLRTRREEFSDLNLRSVSASACFEVLGGRAGGKLADLRAIPPLEQIDERETRFAEVRDITSDDASALDEWQGVARLLAAPQAIHFLSISSLAGLLGFSVEERYSARTSRELAVAVTARGLGLEPDARHGAPSYRASDEVALLKPEGAGVTSSFAGAATLLRLGISIAAADEEIAPAELEVTRDFVTRSMSLNAEETQRLQALEQLLCRNPASAWRSLGTLAKRLPPAVRRRVGELLVCVAAADGVISSPEWRALARACKTLDLPATALEEILRGLGAEVQEVTVQEAQSGRLGEAIAPASPSVTAAPVLTLDMSRVARIAQETTELVTLLSGVMSEPEAPISREAPSSAPAGASPLDSLDPHHRPLLAYLGQNEVVTGAQFADACSRLHLLPLGAFDTINEWADEHLGDFLLEGEDPITVHRHLLKTTS